jgi:Trm5-related predicted tRNA methylase
MKKTVTDQSETDEMRPEYDFRGGVRGKYAERYARGTNVVLLDPDVAEVFPDSEAVNRALRALAGIIREQQSHKPAA